MASKTKIYIVLEYVDGGELFDKIVSLGILRCYASAYAFQNIQTQAIVDENNGVIPIYSRLNMENSMKMLLGGTFNSLLMLWTTVTVEVYTIEILRLKLCILLL